MPDFATPVALRCEVWMQLENPDMSLDDAVAELTAAGNVVVALDEANRRVLVLDETVAI